MKKYEVSILRNEYGKVVHVSKCKLVDDKEYKELIKEYNEYVAQEEDSKQALKRDIKHLCEIIDDLKQEIKVLKGENEDEQVEESIED